MPSSENSIVTKFQFKGMFFHYWFCWVENVDESQLINYRVSTTGYAYIT